MTISAKGGWKLLEYVNVEGFPFLHNGCNLAFVRVRSGFSASGVQVKFNIYSNEIIFIKDGNEMALDSVDFASNTAIGKKGEPELINLKTGFPEIDGNTSNTIYQVLDSGSKIQLLKYYSQKLEDVRRLGETILRDLLPAKFIISKLPPD